MYSFGRGLRPTNEPLQTYPLPAFRLSPIRIGRCGAMVSAEELIARGRAAASNFNAIVEETSAGAAYLKASMDDASFRKSVNPPPLQQIHASLAPVAGDPPAVQTITLELEEKISSIDQEIYDLIHPPPRKRTPVWGGAHAIERGALRAPPPGAPARVYNMHAPSKRRVAAIEGLVAPLSHGLEGAVAGVPMRQQQQQQTSLQQTSMRVVKLSNNLSSAEALIPPPRSRGKSPAMTTGAYGARSRAAAMEQDHGDSTGPTRDGLTPGQRALGATGHDRHAPCRALATRYPGSVPMLPKQKPGGARYGGFERMLAARGGASDALLASKAIEGHRRHVLRRLSDSSGAEVEANAPAAELPAAMEATLRRTQSAGSLAAAARYGGVYGSGVSDGRFSPTLPTPLSSSALGGDVLASAGGSSIGSGSALVTQPFHGFTTTALTPQPRYSPEKPRDASREHARARLRNMSMSGRNAATGSEIRITNST